MRVWALGFRVVCKFCRDLRGFLNNYDQTAEYVGFLQSYDVNALTRGTQSLSDLTV